MNLLILSSDMLVGGELTQDGKANVAALVFDSGLGKLLTPAVLHTVDDRESMMTMAAFVHYGLGVNVVSAHAWERGDDKDLFRNRRPLSRVYVTTQNEVHTAFRRYSTKGFTLIGTERPILPLVGILVLEQRNEMLFVFPGIRLHCTDDGAVEILQN